MKLKQAIFCSLITVIFILSPFMHASDLKSAQRLMPVPAHLTEGAGELVLPANFAVAITGETTDARLKHAVDRFRTRLGHRTGMQFAEKAGSAEALIIECRNSGEKVQKLEEEESYRLSVTETGIKLTAANPLGVMHGLQTLLQLAQPAPVGTAVAGKVFRDVTFPVVTIEDAPRFPWRGLLIDVSRHFMPVEVIKRNLDGMEAVKLNVLHWHLSDDQAFRVESHKFPALAQKASGGQFYTHDQIKDVIA